MKKRVLLGLILIQLSICASARGLKKVSGSLEILKEKADVTMTLNLEDATWEEDETFEEYCEDEYQERVQLLNKSWKSCFKKHSTGLTPSDDAPKYSAKLTITNFEQKQGSNWGRMRIALYGTMTISELSSGNDVLVMKLDGFCGSSDYNQNDRLVKAVDELCEKLFDL